MFDRENHIEDKYSLYGQSAQFITVTAPDMHSYQWTFNA
jgi:hypothetical protein